MSKDLTEEFKGMLKSTVSVDYPVDFDVVVLGHNVWPLRTPDDPFLIPREILPTYLRCNRFYQPSTRVASLLGFGTTRGTR